MFSPLENHGCPVQPMFPPLENHGFPVQKHQITRRQVRLPLYLRLTDSETEDPRPGAVSFKRFRTTATPKKERDKQHI